jgi:hypothetical protein
VLYWDPSVQQYVTERSIFNPPPPHCLAAHHAEALQNGRPGLPDVGSGSPTDQQTSRRTDPQTDIVRDRQTGKHTEGMERPPERPADQFDDRQTDGTTGGQTGVPMTHRPANGPTVRSTLEFLGSASGSLAAQQFRHPRAPRNAGPSPARASRQAQAKANSKKEKVSKGRGFLPAGLPDAQRLGEWSWCWPCAL